MSCGSVPIFGVTQVCTRRVSFRHFPNMYLQVRGPSPTSSRSCYPRQRFALSRGFWESSALRRRLYLAATRDSARRQLDRPTIWQTGELCLVQLALQNFDPPLPGHCKTHEVQIAPPRAAAAASIHASDTLSESPRTLR